MASLKDLEEFARVKDELKKRFEFARIGEETLYIDQTNQFKPLIDVQNANAKAIQDKITSGQDGLVNALIPYIEELKKRNDQVEELQSLPFYTGQEIEDVPQSLSL